MVNKKHDNNESDDVTITTDDNQNPPQTIDQAETEETQDQIISKLKKQLKDADADKRKLLEDLQRTKADFLNARKRLEEERLRDRRRATIQHIEDLLPLCDSFEMALSNKEVWEKADLTWRRGVEGIHAQLQSLLNNYQVITLKPVGDKFDPTRHEALNTAEVKEESQHDTVIAVIQSGYEIKHHDGTTELIRPARVTIGEFTK